MFKAMQKIYQDCSKIEKSDDLVIQTFDMSIHSPPRSSISHTNSTTFYCCFIEIGCWKLRCWDDAKRRVFEVSWWEIWNWKIKVSRKKKRIKLKSFFIHIRNGFSSSPHTSKYLLSRIENVFLFCSWQNWQIVKMK